MYMHIYMDSEDFHQYFTESEMGQLNRTFAHDQLWAWSHSMIQNYCNSMFNLGQKRICVTHTGGCESHYDQASAEKHDRATTRKARAVWPKIFKFWFTAVFNLSYSYPDPSQSSFCMKPLGSEADWLWCLDPELKLCDFNLYAIWNSHDAVELEGEKFLELKFFCLKNC